MEQRNNMCYGVDMSREVWRTKPEWQGYYEFSNYGRCRSLDRVVKTGTGQRLIKGKYIKGTCNSDGFVQLTIKGKKYKLHKIIAELFYDKYNKCMPIRFFDGNKLNCRLDNLHIGLSVGSTLEKIELVQTSNIIQNTCIIEGGFGTNTRVLLDKQLSNKLDIPCNVLRTNNITPNLDNMTEGLDYLDLFQFANIDQLIPLLLDVGYTTQELLLTQHIYIFSERGVAKVMSSLHNSNPAKWEFLNNFVNEYFSMREQLQNPYTTPYTPSNYLEALKQLVKEVEAKELAQKEAKEAKLLAESLKDENTVIKDKLNKMGIKAPYTVTSIQSATKATRTVIVQYMLDNGWVIRRIKDGKPRGFIVVNEDYVAQANGDKVWGIHLTAKGTWHLLEQFKHTQNKLF